MLSRGLLCMPIAALVAALGCDLVDPMPVRDQPPTGLRVVHGGPGTIDVAVDGQVAVRSVAPSSVTAALLLGAGTHRIELRPAGSATALADLSVTVAAGRTRTIATGAAAGGQFAAFALSDTGAAHVAGRSKLRIVHLATNAPAMRAWRVQPDFPDRVGVMFPFPYRSESAYLQSTPGTWQVSVTRQDGGADEPGTWSAAAVLASIGPITIGSGEVRTVVVLDAPGGGVRLEVLDE